MELNDLLTPFIDIFSNIGISFMFSMDNNNLTLNMDDVSIIIKQDNNKLFINPNNQDMKSIQLSNLLNQYTYQSFDSIIDIIDIIIDVIPNLTQYCISCFKKLEFQSEEFVSCGNKECSYKMEELPVGNQVSEYVKNQPDVLYFLLTTAKYAITSGRRNDIFEPFPPHFLKNKVNIKRGTISKLNGINYNNQKDFTRIDAIFNNNVKITTLIKELSNCDTDSIIVEKIGSDMYHLLRFIILSNKCDVSLEEQSGINHKDFKMYRVIYDFIKEDEWKKYIDKKSTNYLFHGSSMENWYSIMRNGLKVCSNTGLMTAGAVYGKGIYLSDSFAFSCAYSHGEKCIMGVYEVVGNKDMYRKSQNIYVVENENDLLLRYLIVIPKTLQEKIANHVTNKFNVQIIEEKKQMEIKASSKGHKKLMMEYTNIQKNDSNKLGFIVEPREDNFFIWDVKIFKFDGDFPIAKDMQKYNIKEIHMEIIFPQQYPFSPPFVRIVTPRFQYQTGHITNAGSICFELLTPKAWSPVYSIESLIVQIKAMIIEGDGRLDKNYNIPYTLQEAKESFNRIAVGHGWM